MAPVARPSFCPTSFSVPISKPRAMRRAGRGIVEVLEAFTAVANARLDTLDREAAVMRQVVQISLTYGNTDR